MALTEEQKNEQLEKKRNQDRADEKEVVSILSSANNVFTEDYNIKELGLNFKISFKVPNLIESAEIEARLQRMFGGVLGLVPVPTYQAYHMYVLLNFEAEKYDDDSQVSIPEELLGEDIYSLKPYKLIAEDYEKFLDRFQG